MCALYAFLRHTDDLADQPTTAPDNGAPDHSTPAQTTLPHNDLAEKRRRLETWREQLTAALAGRYDDARLPALHDVVTRYRIPHEHLYAPIEGAILDLEKHRYETYDELAHYCDLVASSVGQACMHIWGFTGPAQATHRPALACGRAFQLTNILRDVAEDAARGRIYLPQEDLQRHDYTTEDLLAGCVDERLEALIAFQVERAAALYDEASQLWPALSAEGRRMLAAMFGAYRALLAQIAREPRRVFGPAVRVGRRRKLAIAAGALWGRPPRPTLANHSAGRANPQPAATGAAPALGPPPSPARSGEPNAAIQPSRLPSTLHGTQRHARTERPQP